VKSHSELLASTIYSTKVVRPLFLSTASAEANGFVPYFVNCKHGAGDP